eukprot:6078220-Pleurochrysis_carterae.AAC.1
MGTVMVNPGQRVSANKFFEQKPRKVKTNRQNWDSRQHQEEKQRKSQQSVMNRTVRHSHVKPS